MLLILLRQGAPLHEGRQVLVRGAGHGAGADDLDGLVDHYHYCYHVSLLLYCYYYIHRVVIIMVVARYIVFRYIQ